MTRPPRTFTVASDDTLIRLIEKARTRLAVIAPALTKKVAEALVRRLQDLDGLRLTVVLDADPEVYRLGYGDPEALKFIRAATSEQLLDLREQPGVRIGAVICDDTTIVFAPVSLNIEAGSTTEEKPNAIVLSGPATESVAEAAGAAEGATEIGNQELQIERVEKMEADLKANPPKPFDIARRLNVFASRVQYVEFKVSNYRLSKRQIRLPDDFLNVDDADLKEQISSRIRLPIDLIGKVEISINTDGTEETLEVDEKCLERERKSIEDDFTYSLAHHGRVILKEDRTTFDKRTKRFKAIIESYHAALKISLEEARKRFTEKLRTEFTASWKFKAPPRFERWRIKPTSENIRSEIDKLAGKVFDEAVSFNPPQMRVNYKDIAFENVRDLDFVANLRKVMEKRDVPDQILISLFETGQAVPEAQAFKPSS